jgi:hypothetical protein
MLAAHGGRQSPEIRRLVKRVVLMARTTEDVHLRKRSQVLWCVEQFSLPRFIRFKATAVKSAVAMDRLEHAGENVDSAMQLLIASLIRSRNRRHFEILFDRLRHVGGKAMEVQCGRSRPFDAWGARGVSPSERTETAAR